MAQNYQTFKDKTQEIIADTPAKLNGNFDAIRSDYAGAAFPTNDLIEGMSCWRTDQLKLYVLQSDLTTWVMIGKVVNGVFVVSTADSATTASKADLATKATTADSANYANTAGDLSSSGNALGQLLWRWLHRYGDNYVPSDTSNYGWNQLGICIIYYTVSNMINNQPSQYGQLINIPATLGNESRQLWLAQCQGAIYHRGGNGTISVDSAAFVAI